MLIDTHAHIQFPEYEDDLEAVLARAREAGVERIILIGVDVATSGAAVELAAQHQGLYATVGLHPHEAKQGRGELEKIAKWAVSPKVVAIGECGLDYFRNLSSHKDQERAFRFQLELGLRLGIPMVFHVRDAFEEFFKIVDEYAGVRGVVHCFTAGVGVMESAVERGFMIALNGIMTFTKDDNQLRAARQVPLQRLVLETDCPFLTPAPNRGKRNEPANIALTAAFLAQLRQESVENLSAATTQNAKSLFGLK